jgi:hypothetical protein
MQAKDKQAIEQLERRYNKELSELQTLNRQNTDELISKHAKLIDDL